MGISLKTGGGLAIVAALAAAAAGAQDSAETARRLSFTLSQRFSASDNQALDVDSAGTTLLSTTRLGANMAVVNELNQLKLSTSTGLRFGDSPSSDIETGLDNPQLNFSYARTGATASLDTNLYYRSDDIAFLRPLEDFVNDEGELELPEDALDLEGSGTRRAYGGGVSMTLREDAPLSVTLGVNTRRIEYDNVTDPDLFDRRTDSGFVGLGLRFDETFSGRLRLATSHYEAEDPEQTRRDRHDLSFTIDRALSPVLDLTAGLGYTIIDETDTVEGDTRTEDVNGELGLSLARPNGSIGTRFSATTNPDGTTLNFDVSRSLDLPNGGLSATLGVARPAGTDALETTADIAYNRDLPTGGVSFSLSRAVAYDEADDDSEVITVVAGRYSHEINSLSSFGLRGSYSTREDVDRGSISASYSYALTEDWSLSTGYNYDRREDNAGTAENNTLFVEIGRRFDLPF